MSSALLLGLGVAILANSRPYEGFLFCVPAGLWLSWWLIGKIKSRAAVGGRIRIVFLPLSAVLVLTLAFIGYYNWRLTGNALLMPHVLNTRTYHSTPLFLWEHLKPELTYHNQQFEDFYNGWEREDYQTTWKDARDVTAEKLARMGVEFFWPGVLFLLPALPFAFRDRRMRSACHYTFSLPRWSFCGDLVGATLCRAGHLRHLTRCCTSRAPFAHHEMEGTPGWRRVVSRDCCAARVEHLR